MKQYGRWLQKVLGGILAIVMLLSFVACNNGKDPQQGETPKLQDDAAVMTVHGYEISKSVYTIMMYDAAVELRMDAEPEDELSEEEYQEWFFNFFNIEIDGKMPIDIVKETVLENIRQYVYYMQEVQSAGLSMSEADRNDIETNVLITAGDEYDSEHPDDYFIYTYGVTKDQYVSYLVNLTLIDTYIKDQATKEAVSQEAVETYLDTYRSYYMEWSVQNIFLAAATEEEFKAKRALGESLEKRIKDGEDMTGLVAQYSEDGGEGNGIFIISKDECNYPYSILDWVYAAEVNDLGVVSAEDGIYVLKCVTMNVEENARAQIKNVLGMEQLTERITAICQGAEYEPKLNASVYNQFTKLPGDLTVGDDAVG